MFPENGMEWSEIREVSDNLYNQSMGGNWNEVVSIYAKSFEFAHGFKINEFGDTALHFAVSNGAPEDIVKKLVDIVGNEDPTKGALEIENFQGNTPLHLAASMGSLESCIYIAEANPGLGLLRNREGETPLFLAAARGGTDSFFCLHSICFPDHVSGLSCCRKRSGETILHCAIQREYWDLAYQILSLHQELALHVDEQGILPLHLLANVPSAFRSGCQFGFLNSIIYEITHVDEPEKINPKQLIERCKQKEQRKFPENYQTCLDFFQLPWKMVQFAMEIAKRKEHSKGRKTDEETPDAGSQAKDDEAQKNDLLWRIYCVFVKILTFFCQPILYCLGSGSLMRIKQKHILSTKILKMIIDSEKRDLYFQSGRNPVVTTLPKHMHAYDIDTLRSTYWPSLDSDSDDPSHAFFSDKHSSDRITDQEEENESEIRRGYDRHLSNTGKQNLEVSPHKAAKDKRNRETAVHIAAMNGIIEIVEGILSHIPMAIFDVNSEGKNIVLLAVEHKQPEVYSLLKSHYMNRMDSLICKVDHEGNSALHLAAKLTDSNPWPVPGAASQMQWEIRWYEYIMQSMPRMFHYLRNNNGETPEEILWKTHDPLIAERREWLGNTSNACSVVAGLLVTVTFPMSTTVPGGVINETGSPYLKDEPAFNSFAISSYISFYSSLIAVVFLSVLTSAYNKSGFRNDLPTKMLLGLTAFYVSIISTAISFSAGHYFILRDKLKSAAFPAYIGVCLLVIFFAIIEFPLYFQLTWATAKKVPQRQFKVIQGWF